jgi:LPS sulfotransferase NodH
VRIHKGYAICTQPRSGSNLLCQYLASTARLGHPLEYDQPRLQIDAILTIGATPNGVYAVKLFASQFDAISRTLRWTDLLPNLHFVYLTRMDLLGQAISLARSLQSQQYRSTQQAQGTARYDAELIRAQLLTIIRERAQWEAYFARTGTEPLRIVYERFLQDPAKHVARVAALMGLEDAVAIDERKIDLVMQRDALSDEWRRRFHRDCGDPNILDVI